MKRNHLFHLDIQGYYQFITFRTDDSLDRFLKSLATQNSPHQQKQRMVEDHLDSSQEGAYLNDEVLDSLNSLLKSKHGEWYDLIAFSIMPNHVHLLLKPHIKLAAVMQKIKGSSSRSINKIMGRSGRFWAPDYYDRTIRDQKHFDLVYDYIKNNPLKLGKNECYRFYGVYE